MRFLLALLALPLAAATAMVLVDVLQAAACSESFFSVELFSLVAGFTTFCLFWMVFPGGMVRTYVLGHELTHALWGMAFGARPSNLKVSLRGGSVMLTKSNFLITLAPYFFPFYTILTVLAALIVRAFANPLPMPAVWLFAVGFTWSFHFGFTLKSLAQRQPDVIEYGHLFSWVVIWTFNLLGVVLWIVVTTEVSFACAWASVADRVPMVYLTIWRWGRQLYDFLTAAV